MPPIIVDDRSQEDAILVDRTDRVRLEILGRDRAKFLHNLVTNDIKRLPIGGGCEAFVTSPQGKTIGYVILHATNDRILVRTDPGGMALALPHLIKYGVFDDVEIVDREGETFEFHIAGQSAAAIVQASTAALPDDSDYAHLDTEIAGKRVRIIRESPIGRAGLTLIGKRTDADAVLAALRSHPYARSLAPIELDAYQMLRIEAGTPAFGLDITDKNLPQEIGRDSRAISFVKGCYLGQETVARIDAVGHVNQVLKGLILEADAPEHTVRSTVESGGKKVGMITSSVYSRARRSPIALALVRTAQAEPGTLVSVIVEGHDRPFTATVSELPFAKPTP